MSDLIYDFQTDFSSLSWYLSLRLRDAVLEAAIQSATDPTNPPLSCHPSIDDDLEESVDNYGLVQLVDFDTWSRLVNGTRKRDLENLNP